MAANDYYDSHSIHSIQRRPEAPLPPLPPSTSDNISQHESTISPVTSPFDDRHRIYEGHSEQNFGSHQGYHGGFGEDHDREQNPYSDDIPLSAKGNSDRFAPDHLRYDSGGAYNNPDQSPALNRTQRTRAIFSGKIPWVVYLLTTIQVVVFIVEIVRNGALTKSPIEIHPSFNPMIGPSPYVLINMGARYQPCMRAMDQIKANPDISWPCPNTTSLETSDPSNQCTLSQLCGFGDHSTKEQHPNQWFRFIIPMFLHAGLVHIAANMVIQVIIGRELEKDIGSLRFALVYLSSGIFGFVLGGNFAADGIASTGASGSLFGVVALVLLDLLYHWSERQSPWGDLIWIVFGIALSFVLGLLPGLDNFSHIGGFLTGLVLGICILRSPDVLRRRVGADQPPYAPFYGAQQPNDAGTSALQGFAKQPVGFFKGRKALWWVWWLVRAAALIGVLVCFIVLLKNFYKAHPQKCSWCKHLSCLPVKNWCDIGNLQLNQVNTSGTKLKREIFEVGRSLDLNAFL